MQVRLFFVESQPKKTHDPEKHDEKEREEEDMTEWDEKDQRLQAHIDRLDGVMNEIMSMFKGLNRESEESRKAYHEVYASEKHMQLERDCGPLCDAIALIRVEMGCMVAVWGRGGKKWKWWKTARVWKWGYKKESCIIFFQTGVCRLKTVANAPRDHMTPATVTPAFTTVAYTAKAFSPTSHQSSMPHTSIP